MNAEKGKSLESLNLTNQASYTALSAQIDLPSMEHQILEFWRTGEIFAKSTAARDNGLSMKVHQQQMVYLELITLKLAFLRISFHAFTQ